MVCCCNGLWKITNNVLALIVVIWVLCSVIGCSRAKNSPIERAQHSEEAQSPALQRRKCPYGYADSKRIRCYDYYTHGAKDGFKIPVVVIEPIATVSNPPILYLPGGPGASHVTAAASVDQWMHWLDTAKLNSEFILFELRGVEPGSPSWRCATFEELSKNLLKQALTGSEEAELITPTLQQCLSSFDDKLKKSMPDKLSRAPGAGLSLVSTINFATDARFIMKLLGGESWWLLGSSYGTRVAMVLASMNPQVKKVVLDSPYPLGKGALDDAFKVWVRAYTQLFEKYREQNLEKVFWQVMEQLASKPIKVSVENWGSGASVSWLLNDDRLAYALYSAMYSAESYKAIPNALNDLAEGDVTAMKPLLESFYNNVFDRYFNSMVFITTECNDNGATSSASFHDALEQSARWKPYFEFHIEHDICANSLFNGSPLFSHLTWIQPTIVASGLLDPVTNSDYAYDTESLAENSLLIQLQNASHAEFIDSECGINVISLFFQPDTGLADIKKLQATEVCNGGDGQWH